MNIKLEKIIIFWKNWEIREVWFNSWLNIITWKSSTWKSALIKIINYCLFSENSNIPDWTVKDFSSIYGVIFKLNDEYIVIWREESNKNNSYIFKTNNIELISINDFDVNNKKTVDEASKLLLKYFWINTDKEENLTKKEWNVSIRNMLPFLLQPQNTITNEKELFIGFDNNFKKIATIEEFPFFLKIINSEFLKIKRELVEINSKIRNLKIKDKTNQELLKDIEESLLIKIYDFLSNLWIKSDINNLEQLLNEYDFWKIFYEKFNDNNYKEWYKSDGINILIKKREELNNKLQAINNKLRILDFSTDNLDSYYNNSKQVESLISELVINDINDNKCPFCSNQVKELNSEKESLISLNQIINSELSELKNYDFNIDEKKSNLLVIKKTYQNDIDKLNKEISELEKKYGDEKTTIYEKILVLKTEIYTEKKYLDKLLSNIDDISELKPLEEKKEKIYEDLNKLNNENSIAKSDLNKEINIKINDICKRLDIWEEYKSSILTFDVNKFDLFFEKPNWDKPFFYQVWSWANQLTMHLSLFLSILWVSVKRNSYLPKFLFIDQPSQVYFPDTSNKIEDASKLMKDDDKEKVALFLKVILEELEKMKKEFWYEPQIIITDHFNNINLWSYNFDDYVIEKWRDWEIRRALI